MLDAEQLARLRAVAEQSGLLLSLDGLAPEGGEPQLWVVRELQTGLTPPRAKCAGRIEHYCTRSFSNIQRPLADQFWPVPAIVRRPALHGL